MPGDVYFVVELHLRYHSVNNIKAEHGFFYICKSRFEINCIDSTPRVSHSFLDFSHLGDLHLC